MLEEKETHSELVELCTVAGKASVVLPEFVLHVWSLVLVSKEHGSEMFDSRYKEIESSSNKLDNRQQNRELLDHQLQPNRTLLW